MISTLNKPANCKYIFRSVHMTTDIIFGKIVTLHSNILSDGADFCSSTHDDSNGVDNNTTRHRKLEH